MNLPVPDYCDNHEIFVCKPYCIDILTASLGGVKWQTPKIWSNSSTGRMPKGM
jgi:hypothetical protein